MKISFFSNIRVKSEVKYLMGEHLYQHTSNVCPFQLLVLLFLRNRNLKINRIDSKIISSFSILLTPSARYLYSHFHPYVQTENP